MVNPVFQLVQYAYAINVVLASTTSRTSRSHPWGEHLVDKPSPHGGDGLFPSEGGC